MDKVDIAEMTLKNSLSIKRSDRVLIICDENTMEIAQSFYKASLKLCMEPMLMEIREGKHHGDEPPRIAARAMLDSDVIIAPTTHSLTYTSAARSARRKGARIATMPGITMEMLLAGGLEADYSKINRNIKKFAKTVQKAKTLRIRSEEGTDISMSIEGRDWVTDDNGLCHKRGSITNLPAGEVFIAPKENTANGRIVIDGVFIESSIGKIVLEVKDSVVKRFSGPPEVKKLMMRGVCQRTVSEVGIGMNPMAKIIWNILEDQKKLGTVHVGFGDNTTFGGNVQCDLHYDGVILHPTLTIGKMKIIENGNFVMDL